MLIPKFLQEGGTIGVTAPSFGVTTSPYAQQFGSALQTLQEMGYRVKTTPDVFADDGIGISTDPKECAKEFMAMYADDTVDLMISAGGGELMCETLGYIDFDRLRQARPKFFAGSSDNTNLTFTLPTILDTAALYAPNAPKFGMKPWHASIKQYMELLQGKRTKVVGFPTYETESLVSEEDPLAPYHTTVKKEMTLFSDGRQVHELKMQGRLLGGCLDILNILCGTKYDQVDAFNRRYASDGVLWFLESCDLNVLSIRRVLWQLKEAGWFKAASGFIIGRPLNGGAIMGLDHIQAVLGVLKETGVPIIFDADLGHVPPSVPIVSGACAVVQAKGDTSGEDGGLTIEYDLQA